MVFSFNFQLDDFFQLSTLNSQLSQRRDGDSNPGNTFGVYTLSRRASSTTRASLLCAQYCAIFQNRLQNYYKIIKYANILQKKFNLLAKFNVFFVFFH